MPPIRANDPACEAWNKMLIDDFLRKGFYHSIPLPDGRVLEGIISLEALNERVQEFPIAASLAGKRVLDIGTWDGFFAFEMERRGAQVMAIDATEVDNFYVARKLLDSKVEYRVQDVYELSPERNGSFDIVFFMGVLYHLKHPLLALEKVCEVTREMAIVESFVTNEGVTSDMPALEFYETSELLGQIDNWCGPNVQCLLAFCRTAGFARPELIRVTRQRALVACYRHWLPEPESPTAEAPLLLACTHAGNYGVNVSPSKDDYVSAFFKSKEVGLHLDNVYPEVGGFGVRPVSVFNTGVDGWQASFRLPPGLRPGWHDVRLRTANSRFSNTTRIAIDVPAHTDTLVITGACDGKTWKAGEVAEGEESFVALWVKGLPVNGDRGNLRVFLGGKRLQLHDVAAAQGDGEPRQVNAKLPKGFPKGNYDLVITLAEIQSEPVVMRVV